MDKDTKEVITSQTFENNLKVVFTYGLNTFGAMQADKYFRAIEFFVKRLGTDYSYYPECRHIATKNRIYRNIILDSHLIIFRITKNKVEVLDILHSSSSISRIRQTRSIHI